MQSFFSSRRRHMRLQGAWCSAVWSSDLLWCVGAVRSEEARVVLLALSEGGGREGVLPSKVIEVVDVESDWNDLGAFDRLRSEECRVGEEPGGGMFDP